MALFVHPWDMMGADRLDKYWLPWLVAMPAETTVAISSMIFGGVLERLPKLRVAFAHGGGSFPATIGRIEHGFDVRPDLCAVDNNVNPREYLGKFWIDSLVQRIDDDSVRQRWTARKPTSNWSSVNVALVEGLITAGRMRPAGLAAFARRRPEATGIYTYELPPEALPEPYEA